MTSKKSSSERGFSRRGLLTSAGAGVAASVPDLLAGYASSSAAAGAVSSGFPSGFDLTEALDLLAMSNYIYGGAPKPAGWSLEFDGPQLPPLDTKWQLWKKTAPGGPYAVIVRGTVDTAGSILEDVFALLLQATGSITLAGHALPYKFAADPKAGVHAGFALGALLLLEFPVVGILAQIKARVPRGSKIYIAGHSQGAAVATLLRSYLHYGPHRPAKNFSYKTYVFAQPKPGNDHYASDFGSQFSNNGLAYRLTNSLDWVPQVPFTIEVPSDLNTPNPLTTVVALNASAVNGLQASRNQFRQVAVQNVGAKLQDAASTLVRTKFPQAANAAAALPFVESLNFAGAATDISLIGKPCVPGPGVVCDGWYQHHLSTYEQLMKEQLGSLA